MSFVLSQKKREKDEKKYSLLIVWSYSYGLKNFTVGQFYTLFRFTFLVHNEIDWNSFDFNL